MRVRAIAWLGLLCACRPPAGPPAPGDPRFVVAHTGDLHANLRPSPREGSADRTPLGGALALSAEIEQLRGRWGDGRLVLLDAGDLRSGTPLDEYRMGGAQGGVMLEWLRLAGYDAWTVGNHELDRGVDQASAFVEASRVPALSANLRAPGGGPAFPGLRATEVLEVGPLRIAVIGATTGLLERYVTVDLSGVEVGDPVAAVAAEVEAVRGEVDVVVALTHMGLDRDRDLARRVPGIDLIVGGHSHTWMDEPERIDDTWIVHAGCCGRALGVAAAAPGPDGLALEWTLRAPIAADVDPAAASPEVRALVRRFDAALDRDWGPVVGRTTVALLRTGGGDSPLGRFVCRALREHVAADVGLYNAAGLRADLEAGEITREQLYNVFPFGNELVVVEVKGADLVALALRNADAALGEGRAVFTPQDGLTYTYRQRLGAPELGAISVGGYPVDADRIYTIATNSYVAEHWERLVGGRPRRVVHAGVLVRDVVEARLAREVITGAPPPGGAPL